MSKTKDDILAWIRGASDAPDGLADLVEATMGGWGALTTTGGSTAQTGVNGTPATLTGWAANGASPSDTTPDHTTNKITLDVAGTWLVIKSMSFSGSANATFTTAITATSGTLVGGSMERKIGTGGDTGDTCDVALLVGASAGAEVSATVVSDGSNDSLTLVEGELVVVRIG